MDNRRERQTIFHNQRPEAEWNISGMFCFSQFLLNMMDKVSYRLGVMPFARIHGAPLGFLWNGGRVNLRGIPTKKEIDEVMKEYRKWNISLYLTFSNRFIEQSDLDDYNCNYLLESLASMENRENGIIVSSDLLSDYVRKKYPNLHQMASIIKVTCENGGGNIEYYRMLEKKFDQYVVAVDDNYNISLLSMLDKEKAEILVNSRCVRGCPYKPKHYDLMALSHKHHSIQDEEHLLSYQKEHCEAYPTVKKLSPDQRTYTLTQDELQELYDLGFRKFKLQGRYTASQYSLLYDMALYIFEQDRIAPQIFHAFG